jgi:hypothetical protein
MSFYLLCSIILCVRAAKGLYKEGNKQSNVKSEISIDEAHRVNKNYMAKASETLLKIREN